MKIYRRYLMKEVSVGILVVLFAFLSLFAFFDMINEVKEVGANQYRLYHALGFVLLRLPGRVYEIMPFAVLIGTLYTLSALARHSEIAVFRTSGMSTTVLLRLLAQVALGFALATFLMGEIVTPLSEKAAQTLRLKGLGKNIDKDLRSGVWVKDGRRFINIQNLSPDQNLEGIRIYEFDEKANLKSLIYAKRGLYQSPDRWDLKEVEKTNLDKDQIRIEKFYDLTWQSVLTPDILSVLFISPDRMSVLNLFSYIQHLKENRQVFSRYSIALWKKLIYPFSLLVMITISLPFAYTHNRVSGVSLKIFSGVMIGVLFYMLNGIFSNLGAINHWSPFMSALLPSAIFTFAAISMIAYVERR